MDAPIVAVDPLFPQPRTIQRAVALLLDEKLIAYPTDSYYGLGCDLHSKKAIDRLYRLKGHDRRRPMSFLVADLSEVARYAQVSNAAYRILRHLTPGPFTFVLPATRLVPDAMQTRQKTVGMRVPDCPVARALCLELKGPIVSTSAGAPGLDVLADAGEIQETFGHGLEMILDAGPRFSEPSTILSLVGDEVELLRQGRGDASDVLGRA